MVIDGLEKRGPEIKMAGVVPALLWFTAIFNRPVGSDLGALRRYGLPAFTGAVTMLLKPT